MSNVTVSLRNLFVDKPLQPQNNGKTLAIPKYWSSHKYKSALPREHCLLRLLVLQEGTELWCTCPRGLPKLTKWICNQQKSHKPALVTRVRTWVSGVRNCFFLLRSLTAEEIQQLFYEPLRACKMVLAIIIVNTAWCGNINLGKQVLKHLCKCTSWHLCLLICFWAVFHIKKEIDYSECGKYHVVTNIYYLITKAIERVF